MPVFVVFFERNTSILFEHLTKSFLLLRAASKNQKKGFFVEAPRSLSSSVAFSFCDQGIVQPDTRRSKCTSALSSWVRTRQHRASEWHIAGTRRRGLTVFTQKRSSASASKTHVPGLEQSANKTRNPKQISRFAQQRFSL